MSQFFGSLRGRVRLWSEVLLEVKVLSSVHARAAWLAILVYCLWKITQYPFNRTRPFWACSVVTIFYFLFQCSCNFLCVYIGTNVHLGEWFDNIQWSLTCMYSKNQLITVKYIPLRTFSTCVIIDIFKNIYHRINYNRKKEDIYIPYKKRKG